jgi:hypothetical protein
MEKAHCLYALLTEAPIDFDSLVTPMLTNKGVALYGALVTRIAEHVEVPMVGLRETQQRGDPWEHVFCKLGPSAGS